MQVRYQLRHRPGASEAEATRIDYYIDPVDSNRGGQSAAEAAGSSTGTTGQSFQSRSRP